MDEKRASEAAQENLDKLSKTIVLVGFGGYDKLQTWQKSVPVPEEGEILVEVKACGLNFAEISARQGLYFPRPTLPAVLGYECSGVVVKLGLGVTGPKVGARVICMSKSGLWSEYVTLPVDQCFEFPDEMSFEEAAAIPVNYLTAYFMLFDLANLRPNRSVLIHMAAGGVGFAAAQICQTVPNVTTFGTSSEHKHDAIKANGITHPIDYRTKDYKQEVLRIAPKGVDIVLDPLGGKDTKKGYELLKPMGKIIVFGGANFVIGEHRKIWNLAKNWFQMPSFHGMTLIKANKSVCGFHLGMLQEEKDLIKEGITALLEMFRAGKIKPKIDSVFPFEKFKLRRGFYWQWNDIGTFSLLPT
ncbi:synaptic vesicle membrane protein VAT-1 homolog [Saccoglossus kowalevskii]|uniref:Synaptic vesicle membrane protein VAT-1 homolog n=1 Tax=Saccoglossus kowalevskii TaxID=10224 RepID=A0ABM0GVU9_SACKO|nr:PREDICTED: synaptic vesicle membrane protein VAT-1 homolog [Saccoglossus kowalevskii]